ncbi:MAG TPA: hypothetical protein VKY92_26375 [Verrucomicrobiae bacterium]|nr:hypothetical protein [Verrucomicrobiae bacterium]
MNPKQEVPACHRSALSRPRFTTPVKKSGQSGCRRAQRRTNAAEQTPDLHRLPYYDKRTTWFELSAFLGLIITSAALILLTVVDAGRFAQNRNEVARRLAQPSTGVLALTTNSPGSTNLTSSQPRHPQPAGESSRANLFPVPKS